MGKTKGKAWNEITADFNRSSENARTPQQLKIVYESMTIMKDELKGQMFDDKVNNETI